MLDFMLHRVHAMTHVPSVLRSTTMYRTSPLSQGEARRRGAWHAFGGAFETGTQRRASIIR